MTDFEAIDLLENEILKSEARKIYKRIKALTFPYKVFKGNYHELHQLLGNLVKPEVFFRWASKEYSKEREVVLLEIARCLLNYLASASALVDHTRNYINKYDANSKLVVDYHERKRNDFVDQGLPQFVHGLRNHASHALLPVPFGNLQAYRANLDDEFSTEITIALSKTALLRWPNWNSAAKDYLATLDENIDLVKVTNEYFSLVTNFHIWLHNMLAEYHKTDLDWYMSKQLELKKLHTPSV